MRNIVFIYFLLVSSCVNNHAQITSTQKNEELITIDLDAISEGDSLKLSSVFKPVETIILETNENCLIGEINAIQAFDDYLFILDMHQAKGLFVFNREGKFIRRIGSIGKGPGEYTFPRDFTIDPDKKEIYLLDFNTNSIHLYTLEGVYQRTITSLCDARIKSIQYHNGALFTEVKNNSTANDCMMQKIDPEYGQCEASYLSAAQYNLGWNEFSTFNSISGFYGKTGQSPRFMQLFMDTVMAVRQGTLIPYLAVHSKKWAGADDLKKVGREDDISELSGFDVSFSIENYMENEKIILFTYRKGNNRTRTVLYDKKNHAAAVPKVKVNDLMYVKSGLDMKFHFYDKAGVYYHISGFALDYFIGEIKKNKVKPDLDKYAQLKELTEESNPVVFYYEYRD
ncbi:MAG: 6-bladed beta-propeller [Bacteroidales bacterium]|jgi:hypothetical protein|nr:6-bladed beta-propeller [Bacteroidales bacterium]